MRRPRVPVASAVVLLSWWIARPTLAEMPLPPSNPRATLSQVVGITNITVDYNSVPIGGRRLWGAGVAPGALWATVGIAAPTIRFTQDVVFGERAVTAGIYALFVTPSAGDWTVALRSQPGIGPVAGHQPGADVARVEARPEPCSHRERLTFFITDFTDEWASLDLEWGTVRLRVPIRLHTDELITAAIRSLDDAWRWYADAARYLLETRRDIDAGLVYVNRSLVLKETWYNVWIKASLLAAKGDYPTAHAEAERAYRLGRDAGEAFGLEPTLRQALAAWNRPAAGEGASRRLARSTRSGRSAPSVRSTSDRSIGRDLPGGAVPHPSVGPSFASGESDLEPFPAGIAPPPLVVGDERAADIRIPATKPPTAAEFGPVLQKGRPEIQRCYQRALRQNPALTRAKITVSIGVGVSGQVKNIALDPPLAAGSFEGCLKETISRWVFPLSPVEYDTQVPLVLNGSE